MKSIRRLRRSKGGEALLEGPDLVVAALEAGLGPEPVLATSEFLATEAGEALARRLPAEPVVVATGLFATLCDARTPQGIMAVCRPPSPALDRISTERAILPYLDGIQDPGNLGALARTAEATGCTALVLGPGCCDPFHPRALRASTGSLLRLGLARDVEPAELDRVLLPSRRPWVGLDPHGSDELYHAVLPSSLVLVIGSEGQGLGSASRARLDRSVRIPLAPPVESLNVAVATGIVLFELRRRARSGALPAPLAGRP